MRCAAIFRAVHLSALATLLLVAAAPLPAAAGRATLNIVLVLDGLRPDAVTPEETPNLWRLRQEGVNFTASHAVFPTVTRVNATAIGTGTWPGRNGVVGNSQYVRAVDPNHAFVNDDHAVLLRLDRATGGGMVLVKTLGDILQERGKLLAAVSSGSTGSALLTNARAPLGAGILINGYWEPGARVAFPDAVNDAVRRRFGAAPARAGDAEAQDSSVRWTQGVLRDYVLPELKPDVIIDWMTEPDHILHATGAGSPQTRASIRNDDAEVGLLLGRLEALGRSGTTNIMVVSDHGFGHSAFGVNVTAELIKAGLKAGPDSDDVVIASSGQTLLIHVKDRDRARIHKITDSSGRRNGPACYLPQARSAPMARCRSRASNPARSRPSSSILTTRSAGPTSCSPSRGARPGTPSGCPAPNTPTAAPPDRSRATPAITAA